MTKGKTKKAAGAEEVAHQAGVLDEERQRLEQRRHLTVWRGIQDALGAGRLEAIAAGVRYCHRHHQVPPHWFVVGVANLLDATLNPAKRKQGRPKAPADAAIHFARWECIQLLRENGTKFDEAIAEAVDLLAAEPARGGEDAFKRSYKIVRTWIRNGELSLHLPLQPPE